MQVPSSLWRTVAVRACGDGSWPPRDATQAAAFIGECIHEGLLALAFADESLPDSVRCALSDVTAMNQLNRVRTGIFLRTMSRLAEILKDEDYILLKGSDYAFRLYESPYLRQMADIDILVPRERREQVHRRLVSAGVEQSFPSGAVSYVESHHETVFSLGDVTIEVHHSFVQRSRHRIDYDGIWARRVRTDHGWRLEDGDALLYHALGLAVKEYYVPLARYLDLYLLCERYEGPFETLIRRARDWRMERALYASMRQLISVIPEAAPRLQPHVSKLLSSRTRRLIDRHVLPSATSKRVRANRTKQLWRKWNLMDGYRWRIAFLTEHMVSVVAGTAIRRRHNRS